MATQQILFGDVSLYTGNQIANWFPSFSIEVFHGANQERIPEHALEEMVRLTFFQYILHHIP